MSERGPRSTSGRLARLSVRARRALAPAALAVVVACGGGGSGSPVVPDPLPDIVPGTVDVTVDGPTLEESVVLSDETFAASDCAVVEGATQPGLRRLLRFDTVVVNHGALSVTLGNPSSPLPPLTAADFELAPCHGHHHFLGWARYDLLDFAGTVVVTGHKQSFCLLDNLNYVPGPSLGYDCDNQGLSPGWGDIYHHALDGQWVDVTGVPQGEYRLSVTVNAEGKVAEVDDRWPDTVSVLVHLPDPNAPLP